MQHYCPLHRKVEELEVHEVDISRIIQGYKERFDMDVSRFVDGEETLKRFYCPQSAFSFFHPEGAAGDGAFYAGLQKFPWYYTKDKWEHTLALEYIKDDMNILEVGSGDGEFLKILRQHSKAKARGVELNADAARAAQQDGLDVVVQSLDEHVAQNPEAYDLVCSFQVLEHIYHSADFVEEQLKGLKKGGLLLVAVPNNDTYLKNLFSLLNYPPHHMCWWGDKSLRDLGQLFGLELVHLHKETLQEQHVNDYVMSQEQAVISKHPLRSLYYRLGGRNYYRNYISRNREKYTGHTIMAVYRK